MKWLHRICSLVLMAFSGVIVISSVQVGVGSIQSPGPGFMGFFASVLLVILSFAIFIRDFRIVGRGGDGKPPADRKLPAKSMILAAALCSYTFLLTTLGFLVSTVILVFIMLLLNNPRKWVYHLVISMIIVNVSYLVFYKWLRVILPSGIFNIGW